MTQIKPYATDIPDADDQTIRLLLAFDRIKCRQNRENLIKVVNEIADDIENDTKPASRTFL
ncbi:MAG: hypothetical protein ETSY1_23480 [Candidatus Entotheonella factor]|uniref:Uncharacterized protein n=1 Tax=Entotheonella factor TaxID=1429438 RepID=W4LGW0_ENTF1|nr:MAG: hypothetical protein ETSY1_23480 [Candidatus Entotheonella factor]